MQQGYECSSAQHRAVKDDEDAALAETLIDEMETMDVDSVDEAPSSSGATDPRWDGLKKLSGIDSDSE